MRSECPRTIRDSQVCRREVELWSLRLGRLYDRPVSIAMNIETPLAERRPVSARFASRRGHTAGSSDSAHSKRRRSGRCSAGDVGRAAPCRKARPSA